MVNDSFANTGRGKAAAWAPNSGLALAAPALHTVHKEAERFLHGQSDLSSSMAANGYSGSIGVSVGMEWEYFCGSLVETMKTASGEHAGHGGELGALKTRSARP